jgi:hypothetical protein
VKTLDQRALVEACRQLVELVDAPEPGFAVWHAMCADAVAKIRRILKDSEPE